MVILFYRQRFLSLLHTFFVHFEWMLSCTNTTSLETLCIAYNNYALSPSKVFKLWQLRIKFISYYNTWYQEKTFLLQNDLNRILNTEIIAKQKNTSLLININLIFYRVVYHDVIFECLMYKTFIIKTPRQKLLVR